MAPMTLAQAQAYVPEHIDVGHEMIVLAKTFIVEQFNSDVDQLSTAWLRYMDLQVPRPVQVNPTVDPEPVLIQAAKSFSARLAFGEAVWGLIHDGVLLPAAADLRRFDATLEYTTVLHGSGESGGWRFEELDVALPSRVWRAPSWRSNPYRSLSDGDLYLRELGVASVHPLVADSLHEAVRCMRYDLYAPCLAMLTRAVEGAWTEMGLSIVEVVRPASAARANALANDLLDPQYSLARRLTRVADVYDQRDLCEGIWQASDVRPRDLRGVSVWADQVRDSRNVVHYLSEPAMTNTYEKVAALLIGAVPYVRTMYAVHDAAKTLVVQQPVHQPTRP